MAANGDRPRGERAHESTATDVARGVKGRRAPAVAVGLINERGHLVLWDDTRWPETVINREHAVTPPQPRNGRNGSAVSTQAGMGPPYQPRGMGAAGLPSTTGLDHKGLESQSADEV